MKVKVTASLALVAALLLPISHSQAVTRNWQLASTSTTGTRAYIDTATWSYVDGEPSQILFWRKDTGLTGRLFGRLQSSQIGRQVYDCADDTWLIGPTTTYDRRGVAIYSSTTWSDQWQDVIPDSVGEAVRDFVCEDWDTENAVGD